MWLSLPVSFRRAVYLGIWWLGIKLYGKERFFHQRAPFDLYMKRGLSPVLRSGALATILVATRTTVPVPTILDFVNDGDHSIMVMTRIPGYPVREDILGGKMSEEYFESTMRDWLNQLRALPAPNTERVTAFDGGRCMCFRVERDPFGPFPDIASFHRKLLRMCPWEKGHHLLDIVGKSHDKPHRITFTHGDIHADNLLSLNGKMTGLIDWDCAGWFPEYWDYTVAVYHHRRHPFWVGCFSRVFPQYEDELEIEKEIWKVHCPW